MAQDMSHVPEWPMEEGPVAHKHVSTITSKERKKRTKKRREVERSKMRRKK